MQELQDIDASQSVLELTQLQSWKDNILTRLKRLVPGATVWLTAMADEHGQVTTDPARMAELLRDHWQSVFSERGIDQDLLQRWLDEIVPERRLSGSLDGLPPAGSASWRLRKVDIATAIKEANASAPGPDRIPYVAWKRLGHLAESVLFGATNALATETASEQLADAADGGAHDFNLGILCCLPKKASGADPNLGIFSLRKIPGRCPL
jgi:hypothetical protein